jgi:acetylornithine deacetylase/succinyl-diaminopimelate desuccinylase-like protein
MKEIMERLRASAERGAENYLRRLGRFEKGREVVEVRYDKLHNAAFDGDPDSPTARNALAAALACRLPQDKPLLGWTVSCDARLFANEYPGMPVLTFGPGRLAHAHSDQEQIAVEDIRKAAEFLALFILRQTGTVPNSK